MSTIYFGYLCMGAVRYQGGCRRDIRSDQPLLFELASHIEASNGV